MLSETCLKPKQQDAIDRLFGHDETVLVAPLGEGKTVICLTAIKELIEDGVLTKVIVACPAKVVGVWPKEVTKWEHLQGLSVVALTGDARARHRALFEVETGVVVVSLNNLQWLLDYNKHGCDGIIVDELTKAAGKQAAGLRSKRSGGMLKWRVGMTADPVTQSFEKLYGMCRIIDHGKALGTNKERYLNTHFFPDYNGYNWTLRDGADKEIMAKVASLVHVVEDTKSEELPPMNDGHLIRFDMWHRTRDIYDDMKRDMVAADIEAVNEAVKSGKLRQIASGFLYDEAGEAMALDRVRPCKAMDWVRSLEGRKGLIYYEYKEQLDMLMSRYVHEFGSSPAVIQGGLSHNAYQDNMESFTHGTSQVMLAQINSMSHGVDGLQHVCWDGLFYHPIWSRDATTQAKGRLWRTGQQHEVNFSTLVCNDTLDDLVLQRVEDNAAWMKMFKQHLKG